MSNIDPLYETLRDVRLSGSVFCRAELAAPWGFHTTGADKAIFHAVVRGSAWLVPDGCAPIPLDTGELVVIPTGMPHVMCDDPQRAPVPIAGLAHYGEGERIGVLRSDGDGPVTELLCGTFSLDATAQRLLASLVPRVLHVRHGPTSGWLARTLEMVQQELHEGLPGSGLVIDRLADVLLIRVLRAYIATMDDSSGGWLGGLRDERIGRALAWVHRSPGDDWTADAMAKRAGMSRSAFYARFVELVGESPAKYVASWRVQVAQRLLAEGRVLAEVADVVGYSSSAALSKVFKRQVGVSPGAWARAAVT